MRERIPGRESAGRTATDHPAGDQERTGSEGRGLSAREAGERPASGAETTPHLRLTAGVRPRGVAARALAVVDVMARGLVMFGLGLVQIPLAVLVLLCVILTFGLGLVFLFSPAVLRMRVWIGKVRRYAEAWSGVEIADPYRPQPPPPVRGRDGWYQEGRTLYKSPRYPAWSRRLDWVLKDPATWRDLAWLLLYPLTGGLIAVLPWVLLGSGALMIASGSLWQVVAGPAAVIAGVLVAPRIPRLYGLWSRALLGPTEWARLAQQVSHLTRTRTEAVDSQTAELHRIERDLHDGAQARLVAMGMTLGAAEQLLDSDPAAARALIAKTREASASALAELRQLVRGIHPPVLAERGLGDAVRALALDSPLSVTVSVDLPERPEPPVESAVYFAISELLTNAARHGDAREVAIDISRRGTALRVSVIDDGVGGADPSRGSGLSGLERRLATFDGVLALNSPPGGPTAATIELPYALPPEQPQVAKLPRWKTVIMGVCMGLFWLPLFPQGLVTLVFKLLGFSDFSWFLALYLPDPLSWATIIVFINLGLVMLITGAYFTARHERSKTRWSDQGC